ncbi:hypothetical protein [Methanobrevibacter sp.]|uniref:hypothetical protein n=1 Tax=Methanobrevibacter sp. TaxID=66852 RepID=UPI0038683FDA
MKDLTKTLGLLFGLALIIWAIGFTAPKLIDIYKNKPVEKVDTVYYSDTVFFERTVTDTMPVYRYETIVKRDTLYKLAKGDSIERIPRVVTLKKKATLKHYPLGVIR